MARTVAHRLDAHTPTFRGPGRRATASLDQFLVRLPYFPFRQLAVEQGDTGPGQDPRRAADTQTVGRDHAVHLRDQPSGGRERGVGFDD